MTAADTHTNAPIARIVVDKRSEDGAPDVVRRNWQLRADDIRGKG